MPENTIVATIAAFISQVGFPIFVAVYVLMRLESTINKLNETVSVLTIITAKQSGIDYEQVIRDYRINGGRK